MSTPCKGWGSPTCIIITLGCGRRYFTNMYFIQSSPPAETIGFDDMESRKIVSQMSTT